MTQWTLRKIVKEFYRDLSWVEDEYKSGEAIDFEGATLENANLEGAVSVEDTDSLVSSASVLDFHGDGIDIVDEGSGEVQLTIGVDANDLAGNTIAAALAGINAGSNLSWTDNGDGTATLDADASGTGKDLTLSQGRVTLSDTEALVLHRFTAPTGATLELHSAGVADSTGSAPTGLTLEVYNNTDAVSEYQSTVTYEEGSPLASVGVGGDDLEVRLVNETGGGDDFTGFITGVLK